MDAETAQVAAVAGALGAATVLLARTRWLLLAGLVLLGAAELGLGLALAEGRLTGISALAALAGAGVAVAALSGATGALVAWPAATLPALLVAAPFRPPVSVEAGNRFLVGAADPGQLGRLLPLYFVLAAAVLALAYGVLVRGREVRALPRLLALPAAAFFALAALSLLWTEDIEAGAELLAFFLLPFAALVAVAARSPFPPWMPRALAIVAISLAAAFAAIGIWQAIARELFFFAPTLELSNENNRFFRVTSLFGDPSLYGRHVVLGLGVVLALLALRRVRAAVALPLIALLWAGLLFSYSQSSMVALVAVALGIAALAGGRGVRIAVAACAGALVLVAAGVVVASAVRDDSVRQATSDRSRRVEETARAVAERPVAGVGLGAQPQASQRLSDRDEPRPAFVSHATPLTVAAELGALGLALYAWLLVNGVRMLEAVRRRAPALGLALLAAFGALFAHALFYSGFVEDPITWAVLSIGAAYLIASGAADGAGRLARAPRRQREDPAPVAA